MDLGSPPERPNQKPVLFRLELGNDAKPTERMGGEMWVVFATKYLTPPSRNTRENHLTAYGPIEARARSSEVGDRGERHNFTTPRFLATGTHEKMTQNNGKRSSCVKTMGRKVGGPLDRCVVRVFVLD